ncbi:acyl-CoA dehydrogenase, N-terminal domain protein [Mycolicibacterium hassiacum DSM 44199]|jgi:alkylation response protein AidB-like acyl-CoA dehydrogenase|uniref:Acyl-CoA dehydrogenase, N-terminal domain protein n=1 Tax=Mycolicibacterium hassiacum (strain DSM 44199 / CIP 105218 / JCM 12690 / 3849) TaxID=1122247 RepID=K5BD22_MYCHD|nr:acyl-CoA dehydrogenase family protein [Mycolicibacterium hassiacum]EKF25620.1 acyl-CoA dehydrogenase, N-terminal domain protein [Mycolicibacterium hassiacum DSM 44199]MBX5488058.1 acyl-CoA dehydrogenase family protein [Mycolicibacterium hassiacum]MDA4084540.1 acyl-CoA dehydrogenase [Mycolicibacterium hassiacum DSM 44199]PZN25444.1 MAG: acyl-CoA dehydrogenase [Mycolicibacterium hassiacum]VCT90895.1 Putative acyl-CoA dehydrogenase FadE17 [Mycolicibacterium hassiacum DSM 44199]
MTASTDVPTTVPGVEEFRAQLVEWLEANDLTPPPGERSMDAHQAQHLRVLAALYDAGWMRWGWPVEAGGFGGPPIFRAIVGEEVVGRGLDHPGPYSMLEVLTPTMIDYARPELAAEMVPRLLSGKESWCQGFSEPGSGSDLASITTRAEQRGDTWVINGQKVWTSFAQYATRCILLTRTGGPDVPNHKAITAFFVDVDSPGVTVRPLRTMHGVDEFCEVYFDDVVVPADRMLGGVGDGWQLAMDLLPYERSTCFWQRIAYLYSRFDALVSEAKGLGTASDADLGEVYLALHTLRCRSRETQHRLAAGHKLGAETSIDKVLLATAEQQLYDTVRDLLPGVIELDDSNWRIEYLYSRAATIYGGTAEVQRNIIARRLLDLGKE